MLDIEEFSLCAWNTPHARMWNTRNKRGIKYMGYERIADAERFFPHELRRKKVVERDTSWYSRGT